MAATRTLDVWIVDLNKVYTGVPFTVVTDWLQEGRLLDVDRVRLAGKQQWHQIAKVPALAPYLPKPAPLAAEDRAEAEEPIDLGFQSSQLRPEEDDDVDMIPLIDVSLVLLIFFMMTSAISAGVFSAIPTPEAKHQLASVSVDMFWLGIERDKEGTPLYSLGKDSENKEYLVRPTKDGTDVFAELARLLQQEEGKVEIRLRADKSLPIETIKSVTLDLQGLETLVNQRRAGSKAKLQIVILGEVSEPAQ